ncbi:MAG: ferritin family protein, partial [Thermodesulfovibrionales bacterium]|nr:ferritin family protein [Thermodesulfovibrionales bacterium]
FLKGIGFAQVYSMERGMLAWQGLQAEGSYDMGMNLINKDMDLKHFAALTWAMEDGTGKFYTEISELVKDEGLKKLLKDLASAEQRHQDNILKSIESVGENISDVREIIDSSFKDIMEGGISLNEAIEKIKLAKPFEESVVEFSMQIEINSLDLYLKIFNMIEEDEAKDFINSIIEEEKVHLKRLGDVIERLNK